MSLQVGGISLPVLVDEEKKSLWPRPAEETAISQSDNKEEFYGNKTGSHHLHLAIQI